GSHCSKVDGCFEQLSRRILIANLSKGGLLRALRLSKGERRDAREAAATPARVVVQPLACDRAMHHPDRQLVAHEHDFPDFGRSPRVFDDGEHARGDAHKGLTPARSHRVNDPRPGLRARQYLWPELELAALELV